MYASYLYYTDEYGGSLSEPLFNKYVKRAEKAIDHYIREASVDDKTAMQDNLAMCECELVDHLETTIRVDNDTQHGNITSQSNDGVSVSYGSKSSTHTSVISHPQTHDILGTWLTYPRNLMYTGR